MFCQSSMSVSGHVHILCIPTGTQNTCSFFHSVFFDFFKIKVISTPLNIFFKTWVYFNFNNIGSCIKIALLCQLLVIVALKTYRQEKPKQDISSIPSACCLNSTPLPSPSSCKTMYSCIWLCGLSSCQPVTILENRKRTGKCVYAHVCANTSVCVLPHPLP